jgi:hypothetical protein
MPHDWKVDGGGDGKSLSVTNVTKTQLLPPWKAGDAVGESSFHLITQVIFTGDTVVHGSKTPGKTYDWTNNGCGPASVAANMRWYAEQSLVTWAPLVSVAQDATKQGDAREYMKLLFPDLNGRVPFDGADNCDHQKIYAACLDKTGLAHVSVTLDSAKTLAGLLQSGPVICTWSDPSHFSTVHGIVDKGGKFTVWIADPGKLLKRCWSLAAGQLGAGVPKDFNPNVYVGVDWDFFKGKLSAACQLQPQKTAAADPASGPLSGTATAAAEGVEGVANAGEAAEGS